MSPYLKNLNAEKPRDPLESVSVSVCDHQTITPESTEDQLDTLRASAYALLAQELAPLNVEIKGIGWLTGGFNANIPLKSILEVAERADVLYINSNHETALPP